MPKTLVPIFLPSAPKRFSIFHWGGFPMPFLVRFSQPSNLWLSLACLWLIFAVVADDAALDPDFEECDRREIWGCIDYDGNVSHLLC